MEEQTLSSLNSKCVIKKVKKKERLRSRKERERGKEKERKREGEKGIEKINFQILN